MATEVFADNFDRADNDSLGANWTEVQLSGGSLGNYTITSNVLRCGTVGNGSLAICNTSMGSANQYVKATINGSYNSDLAGRINSTSSPTTAYTANYRVANDDMYLVCYENGVGTNHYIQKTGLTGIVDGDTYEMQIETTDASTVTVRIYRNGSGSTLTSWADTDADRVLSGNYVGVYERVIGNTWNDFSGGTLASAGSTSPSISPSISPSASPSTSLSPSISPSASPSTSISPSVSPSVSPSTSLSPSVSLSVSPSKSPSASPSFSPSKSPSVSPSFSPSVSPSVSPSQSLSPSNSPSLSPSVSVSVSPSTSPSQSPSRSVSPSFSPSFSPSISLSISPSTSPSVSPSSSFSPSFSPSISLSSSPSLSLSISPSVSLSVSPSISPSISSPETKVYTRGDYATLPANDTNLETSFTAGNYTDVETDDNVYVDQTATAEYPIFQFKDQNTNATDSITPTWKGKSSVNCAVCPILLQIYDRVNLQWNTIADDWVTEAGTELTLSGTVEYSLENYYDASNWISCRVTQDISEQGGGM